ncbi:TonB-dependent receptor [Sphingomonas populi]|uniref:TonB-dependent receptor n=1 Tax=Sphingomonas populi TaxID=2484750 RepID=A0A4Q6XU24_9SPHN|nr:TonB-dependent receptor [Sphingomonas populi]RZF63471.1 TonB-dependent receptor [Sphingomonas populi]
MKDSVRSSSLARTTSTIALAIGLMLPAGALAQTAPTGPGAEATNAQPAATDMASTQAQASPPSAATADDIVVTGIRASLERSISIKRNSTGIVDAISSEDIGKFPDTNLAESLQRVTGVSINRRNGEGAQVTVRGFGPDYNMVTLNGRQLAASDQTSVGGENDFTRSTGRSFDFSNLASEGVRTLEVYKTGRAAIPSGGIGAAINVVTRRPLDARESGFNGSIGGKVDYDTSADDCIKCGSHATPNLSGLLSWSNPAQTFGVSLFGSYQVRHFSAMSASVNGWNISSLADLLSPSGSHVSASTKVQNAPSDLNALVARPDDARYHFAEDSNQRINLNGTLQFKPTDTLTLTADGLFAQNRASERRSDEANWFQAAPFDVIGFDKGYQGVYTATYLHETNGGQKDSGAEQQYRAQKNVLKDFGGNIKWDVTDHFTLTADGHIGSSDSTPDNPNGMSSTLASISIPTLNQHSWDYSGNGFPVQTVQFLDPPGGKGNGNGILDVGDLGSQVGRQIATSLRQRIKEGRLDAGWDLGGGSRFDFGGDYRATDTRSQQTVYNQTLGDWGNSFPRDVQAIAPGQVNQFCLVCQFTHFDPKASGDDLVAFRTEDATKLYNALSSYYAAHGQPVAINGYSNDRIKEDIWAIYGQFTWKGEIAGHNASMVAGARYEHTTVNSSGITYAPADIRWQSDNDFTQDLIFDTKYLQTTSGTGKYSNLLPSLDFQLEIKQNLIGRFSFSKTIARPTYNNLFTSASVTNPNDATFVGGQAGGSQGNPGLLPLSSDNFDVSLEWYFKPDSYISVGFFDKRVQNFIGTSVVKKSLYGLRDPTSGTGGRSGTANTQLQSIGADVNDTNLFVYTALLDKYQGSTAAATQEFQQNYNVANRQLNLDYVNLVNNTYDVVANSNDPFFQFNVSQPTNNKSAEIYGVELAGQYFFGGTGIGVAAQYTLVRGNIAVDVAAPINADQFALVGLSDTANATLIYNKYGISARLSYNWRDKFLSAVNADGFHSPRFTAPHSQVDFNVSYDITPHIAVSVEGINIFEDGLKVYGRSPNEIFFMQEGTARYLAGARFKF